MLSVSITIRRMDYEGTLRSVFPALSGRVREMDPESHLIIRLFQHLGDAALPVLLGVMRKLETGTKNELLVRTLNACGPELREKLDEELRKDPFGRCFSEGGMEVTNEDGILLHFRHVEVDYAALLKNDQVQDLISGHLGRFSSLARKAADLAAAHAPDSLEKTVLTLLWRDDNKERLKAVLGHVLDVNGIHLEIGEIRIVQEEDPHEEAAGTARPFVLTPGMEDDILSALAAYLREQVSHEP